MKWIAVHIAEKCADVDVDKPDERSIMTYVAKFLEKFPARDSDFPDISRVSCRWFVYYVGSLSYPIPISICFIFLGYKREHFWIMDWLLLINAVVEQYGDSVQL